MEVQPLGFGPSGRSVSVWAGWGWGWGLVLVATNTARGPSPSQAQPLLRFLSFASRKRNTPSLAPPYPGLCSRGGSSLRAPVAYLKLEITVKGNSSALLWRRIRERADMGEPGQLSTASVWVGSYQPKGPVS